MCLSELSKHFLNSGSQGGIRWGVTDLSKTSSTKPKIHRLLSVFFCQTTLEVHGKAESDLTESTCSDCHWRTWPSSYGSGYHEHFIENQYLNQMPCGDVGGGDVTLSTSGIQGVCGPPGPEPAWGHGMAVQSQLFWARSKQCSWCFYVWANASLFSWNIFAFFFL